MNYQTLEAINVDREKKTNKKRRYQNGTTIGICG